MRDAVGRVRTVFLLGGTSEIGMATVEALVRRRGARQVVLAGRQLASMEPSRDRLLAAGADDVELRMFDATELRTHEALVEDVWRTHGDIDVSIAAFGSLGDQLEDERDRERAVEVVTTNYVGAVSVGVPVSQQLRRQGHGVLILLSSVAAVQPRRANFIYGSAKAGLDAFGRGLGDALAGTGGRVLVVRPGFVRTKMTAGMEEAPFSTSPGEVARHVLDALDSDAPVVHVPPIVGVVGAVLRNLPRTVVRRLPR